MAGDCGEGHHRIVDPTGDAAPGAPQSAQAEPGVLRSPYLSIHGASRVLPPGVDMSLDAAGMKAVPHPGTMASRQSGCYILALTMLKRMRLFGFAILVSANLWYATASEKPESICRATQCSRRGRWESGPSDLVLDSGSIRTSLDDSPGQKPGL